MEPAARTEYLTDAVFRLERAVANIGAMRLKPWRMTLSGYAALTSLERQPNLSLAHLSRRCYVKPQTMTRIVSEMERRGWVARGANPDSEGTYSRSLNLMFTKSTGFTFLHDRPERHRASERTP